MCLPVANSYTFYLAIYMYIERFYVATVRVETVLTRPISPVGPDAGFLGQTYIAPNK